MLMHWRWATRRCRSAQQFIPGFCAVPQQGRDVGVKIYQHHLSQLDPDWWMVNLFATYLFGSMQAVQRDFQRGLHASMLSSEWFFHVFLLPLVDAIYLPMVFFPLSVLHLVRIQRGIMMTRICNLESYNYHTLSVWSTFHSNTVLLQLLLPPLMHLVGVAHFLLPSFHCFDLPFLLNVTDFI